MANKYRLSNTETKSIGNVTLKRVISNINFNAANNIKFNIKAGDRGGYIQSQDNLSQLEDDTCWVGNEACVFGNARVKLHAYIYLSASVYGNAIVKGSTRVFGNAEVFGNAILGDHRNFQLNENNKYVVSGSPINAIDLKYRFISVSDNAWVYGDCVIQCGPRIYGNAEITKGIISGYILIFGNAIIDTYQSVTSLYSQLTPYDQYWSNTTGYIFDNAKIISGSLINFIPYPNKLERRGSAIKYTGKIFGNAIISNSVIEGHPLIFDNALIDSSNVLSGSMVYGSATVRKSSIITDYAKIYDNANVLLALAIENCNIYGSANIIGTGSIIIRRGIFYPSIMPIIRGNARIFDNALIQGHSIIQHNAQVYGNARVQNAYLSYNASVYENSMVLLGAKLFDNCNVYGNSLVSGEVLLYDQCNIYENAIVLGLTKIGDDARVHGSVNVRCLNNSADFTILLPGDRFPSDPNLLYSLFDAYDTPVIYPAGSENRYHNSPSQDGTKRKSKLLAVLYELMYRNGLTELYRLFPYKRITFSLAGKKTTRKIWKVSMSIIQQEEDLQYYNIGDTTNIYGQTLIRGAARINDNAEIMGTSYINGSLIYGDAIVSSSIISGNCHIYGLSKIINVSNSAATSGLFNINSGSDSAMRIYDNTQISRSNDLQLIILSGMNIFGDSIIETRDGHISIYPYGGLLTPEYNTIYNTQIYTGKHMLTTSAAYSNSTYPPVS